MEDNDKWLMFNAKFSSADAVFESIYRKAKSTMQGFFVMQEDEARQKM